MKIILILLFAAPGSLFSQAQDDPIARHLVSPDRVMAKADAIGLTAEQREALRQIGEAAHVEGQKATQILKEAMMMLGADLGKDVIDEEAAAARLDAVLDAERTMKRIHLQTLVRVHNLLSADQQQAMRDASMEGNGLAAQMAALEKSMKAKVERVEEGIRAKMQAGQQPTDVFELMQGFPRLMEQSKHVEAEALLDRALELLEGAKPDNQEGDSSAMTPPASMGSAEELGAEIAAMRVDDVAWRQIAWKTCLVEGIKASREQKKPILLWCFIDRPIDDKRC